LAAWWQFAAVAQRSGAMHVAKVSNRYRTKSGADREYVSHQLRRTFREGGKVTHETLANLSALPIAAIEAVRAVLAGKTVAVASEALTLIRSLPHGHAAAVWAQAKAVGLPELLGPPGGPGTWRWHWWWPGWCARRASWLPPAGGPTPPWPPTSAWRMRPGTRPTRH